jgi:hypothetical protein
MQLSEQQSERVTATQPGTAGKAMRGALLAAALAMPGISPPAHAEGISESGVIGLRYLYYKDYQPGLDRIRVSAPSVYFQLPTAGNWGVAGSFVSDSVSGASPRWHTSISSASRMRDLRNAGDIRITRYESRSTYSLSLAGSKEHDYLSRSGSFTATFSTEDNNRTWAVGAGYASDIINPVNQIVVDERRKTSDVMLGVTQVLTPVDIVQANLTHARARGYMNDPYKLPDQRPRERDQSALLLRWNHYFAESGNTLKLAHRFYTDTYGIRANTTSAEYVVPVKGGWTLTPLLRYHQQNAAKFYYDPVYDPVLGEPYPPGYLNNPNGLMSPDQRLSAFGAGTIGMRVAKQLEGGWSWDIRAEYYEQRGEWRLFGTGSPGLAPFSAWMIQSGVAKTF